MLEKIIEWGKKEESIRALILLGSRASRYSVDPYSDYDISVFCNYSKPYTESEEWLSQFGNVLVCVKEKIVSKRKNFPSRLVIFESGIKVDFSFFPVQILNQIVHSNSLPDEYTFGYKVLLDKESRTEGMLSSETKVKSVKPKEKEFHRIIDEFWFEIYHVGICLKRDDLWLVKFRSWAAASFLLQMIEWHAQACHDWQLTIQPNGKRMFSWIDKSEWQNLHGIFAHFDVIDSWRALSKMMELFRRITAETARALQFSSMEDLSEKMMRLITTLESSEL